MKMADRVDADEKGDGAADDSDHGDDESDHNHNDATELSSNDARALTASSSSSDMNKNHPLPSKGPQRSSWDYDEEDPRKMALFKNSVLSRLNMDAYDDDDATIHQSNREGGKMKMMVKEGSVKKKGLIRKGMKSKSGDSGSDSDLQDQSFDGDDSVMTVTVVPQDSVVLQAGINKKRQLVIDSDEE